MNELESIKTISAAEIMATDYPEQEWIYELRDPRDWSVRYVGRSKDPWQRWYQHQSNPQEGRMKDWIKDLDKNKLEPYLDFVMYFDVKVIAQAEKNQISARLAEGCDLLNTMHNDIQPRHLTKRAADVCHSCGATMVLSARYCHVCGTHR